MAELFAMNDMENHMIGNDMTENVDLELDTGLNVYEEDGNNDEETNTELHKAGHTHEEDSKVDDNSIEAITSPAQENDRDRKEASKLNQSGDEVIETEQRDDASEGNNKVDTSMGLGSSIGDLIDISEDNEVPAMGQTPNTPHISAGIDSLKEVDDFEAAFGLATPNNEQIEQAQAGNEHFASEDGFERAVMAQFDGGNDGPGISKGKGKEKERDHGPKEVLALQEGADDQSSDSESDFSVDSTEYVFIHQELELCEEGSGAQFLHSESFPGTWEGAMRDAGTAINQVAGATTTYYQAIKNSNLRKAGLSLLQAGAGTANRSALTLAGAAINVSGADRTSLPGGAQKWLKKKDEMDAARERAKAAESKRQTARIKDQLIRDGTVLEPPRVRPKAKARKSTDSTSVFKAPSVAAEPLQYPADLSDDALEDVEVDRLRGYNVERGIIQERFATPATVRLQLQQPLQTPSTPSHPPPSKMEESPYPPSDEEVE